MNHDEYSLMGYIYITTDLVRGMDVARKNVKRIQQIIDMLDGN